MSREPVDTSLTITARLRERLLKGKYATDKTAINDNSIISNLKCPVCNDKTAWAYYDKPFLINCNKKNKCGKKTKTLELFPDINSEKEYFEKLEKAKTAQEYAEIVYSYRGSLSGLLEIDGCLYWPTFTSKKRAPTVKTVARFTLKVKYFNRSEKDPKDVIDSYCVEITPKSKRKSFTATMTHNDLATPNGMQLFALKKRVVWAGNREATLALAERITEADAPTVREVDIYGYDKKSGSYVFPAFGINKDGEYIKAEGSGFIYTDKAKKEAVKACHSPSLIEPQTGINVNSIYKFIAEAWPENGEIAFTWTVASWFVNQIKDKIKQFPILSLYGEPSSGKSFLTKTLKALQCENSEGLPMRKSNTAKGELRKLTQRSGLFEALIEWPENGQARFELENILTMYNIAPLHIMALKSNDNRTVELPFLGALMFVQNRDIFQNEQQKERVIALKFSKTHFTPATTEAFNKIFAIPDRELADAFVQIMTKRKNFENNWLNEYQKAVKELKEGGIKNSRIAENYGLILAFHRLLDAIVCHKNNLKPCVFKLAEERENACLRRSQTVADAFLDCLSTLDINETVNFCKVKDDQICFHLVDALNYLKNHGRDIRTNLSELQRTLEEHPNFIKNNCTVRYGRQTQKSWIFKNR